MLTINKNCYYLRIINNKSQKELSELFSIPQTRISRIENGLKFPTLEDLVSYSIFFDVSLDDLVFKEYNFEKKEFEDNINIQHRIHGSIFFEE